MCELQSEQKDWWHVCPQTNEAITSFKGQYRFLSNFYPVEVELDGIVYQSVEHAYQAAKTTDPVKRAEIAIAETAARAKKLGQRLARRPDWETVRLPTMEALLRQKFAVPENAALLVATGRADLVEGNFWHDQFWGTCTCAKHKGLGENHLGDLLMTIRAELQAAKT